MGFWYIFWGKYGKRKGACTGGSQSTCAKDYFTTLLLFSYSADKKKKLVNEVGNSSLFDIYLSLFIYIGLEKPQWGVAN